MTSLIQRLYRAQKRQILHPFAKGIQQFCNVCTRKAYQIATSEPEIRHGTHALNFFESREKMWSFVTMYYEQ